MPGGCGCSRRFLYKKCRLIQAAFRVYTSVSMGFSNAASRKVAISASP